MDLGDEREIHRVAMGFLQDSGSWVLMPRRVRFAISTDGISYREVGSVENEVPEREMKTVTKDFAVALPAARARYVSVEVTGAGALPAWHPGAGSPSFFFADEILAE